MTLCNILDIGDRFKLQGIAKNVATRLNALIIGKLKTV